MAAAASHSTSMDLDSNGNNGEIVHDEEWHARYSRQIYVLGQDAMKRMQTADVLIVGLKGLGVEIAKNICLAGVKSVTLHDPEPTRIADLGTQFFLREPDIGQPRDQATLPRIRELNQYVPVNVLGTGAGQISNEVLGRFKVVVLTDVTLTQQLQINDYTHANGIHFIAADVRGLFG